VEANGLQLHYLRWASAPTMVGRGPSLDRASRGTPIVLNHPTGFLAALWQPIAERLADAGYDVYAYDARGHGDSDKPPPEGDNYHWQRFAEDLRAFLDALRLRGVPFAGHSAGGAAGLWLAAHEPQYFSRIVAIEPIVMPAMLPQDEGRRSDMSESARRRRMVFASPQELIDQYRTRPTFEHWTDNALLLYAEQGTYRREDGQVQLKCPGEVEGEIFANSGSLDLWGVLPRIACPVLVLKGAYTEGFLAAAAEGVAGRVQAGRLEIVRDAGHLAPMERPDAVADAILRFLEEA